MEDTWIGLIDETEQGNWLFTDGTTLAGVLVNNLGYKCGRIALDGRLYGIGCDQWYAYICMTKGKVDKWNTIVTKLTMNSFWFFRNLSTLTDLRNLVKI